MQGLLSQTTASSGTEVQITGCGLILPPPHTPSPLRLGPDGLKKDTRPTGPGPSLMTASCSSAERVRAVAPVFTGWNEPPPGSQLPREKSTDPSPTPPGSQLPREKSTDPSPGEPPATQGPHSGGARVPPAHPCPKAQPRESRARKTAVKSRSFGVVSPAAVDDLRTF